MTFARFLLLVLGPLPILFGSVALSRWAKPGTRPTIAANEVLPAGPRRTTLLKVALPDAVAETVVSRGEPLTEACARRANELAMQLGGECRLLIRTPFVLAGNLPEHELARWHAEMIGPATAALDAAYFARSPDQPITVLLLADESSYSACAQQLFGERDVSVYGYYKPRQRTLVMNISTGSGTLVHELTHALIDFDFPRVPDWFNEGLASLHEQCRFRRDGSGIDGLVNWRLPILQQALADGTLRPIVEMIDDAVFRGPREAVNYAQARYLCLFLQERGLLEEYFRRFRAAQDTDPRGRETLRVVLGDRTWNEIDAEFRAWVAVLKPAT